MPASAGARLARHRSWIRIWATPVGSVMLASLLPCTLPMVAQSPAIPPLGLLVFLTWRMVRPELWPLWVGLPLGAFDDLATGHPLGTAMCLWTITLVALDVFSPRLLWREYLQDWLMTAFAIIFVTTMAWLFLDLGPGAGGALDRLAPQMLLAILLYPVAARMVARIDRWRLP